MNLEHLYRFYVCANRKNITRAAEELFLSQPALSKNIGELEDEFGTSLFARSKNGITLTKVGKEIYDHIRPSIEILCNVNKFAANIIDNSKKTIKIGSTKLANDLFLNKKVYKFLNDNPSFNLKLYEDKNEIILQKLKDNELDLIFTFLDINDNNYQSKEILCLDDAFFCSTKNKTVTEPISIKELAKLPLILNAESSSLTKATKDYFWQEKIELALKYEISNNELFNELLVNDLAIGITSSQIVQKLIEEKKIYKLQLATPFPSRKINLIYKKDLPDYIKNFLQKF